MTSYEMEDLDQKRRRDAELLAEERQRAENPAAEPDVARDGTIAVWTFGVAGIATLMSLPLLCFPRVLVFLSATGTELSSLEYFISAQLGILLLVLAAGTMTSAPDGIYSDFSNPGLHPLLAPVSVGASISALVAWNSKDVGSLGTFISIGNGIIGAWGFWALLFAGSSLLSKKTGADKRTSTFLFSNKTAARSQKKEWKARQKNL